MIKFVPDLPTPFNQIVETKTGAYTILSSDINKLIRMNALANFTIDSTTGFSVGQSVDVARASTNATLIVQGSGVTLLSTPGLTLRAQHSTASIICVAANTYHVVGDLSA